MEMQHPALGGRTRRPAAAAAAAAVLCAAFAVVLLLLMLDAGRELRHLDTGRNEALAARPEPGGQVGDVGEAFRRFRAMLDDGTRFALVYGPDLDRDQRGFYRLFAGFFLYPGIAVPDPTEADAVMVFGEPTPGLRDAFEERDVVEGVWLGTRRS